MGLLFKIVSEYSPALWVNYHCLHGGGFFEGGGTRCVKSAVAFLVSVGERSSTGSAKGAANLTTTAPVKRSDPEKKKGRERLSP